MHTRAITALAVLSATLPAASTPASAAPFAPATPIVGFGTQPALAQISGAAIFADGGSVVAGTSYDGGNRRAVMAFGDAGSPPGAARGFGPTSGAFDVALASNAAGNIALTFTVGHTAYLVTCRQARCRPTARVGTSSLKPQSAVAVQPGSGRTIVLWRGRTSHRANRLQWRITTNGKLGRVHTLAEFGDAPKVATDASGKTVAVWLADGLAGRRGVRTAARRVGEFVARATVSRAQAGALRLVSSDGGTSVAAWLAGPNGSNPEGPLGTVTVATRTRSSSFGAPRSLGAGSTLSLAGSPDGHMVLSTDRHVTGTSVVVSAARRSPGGGFGSLADVSPAQFVSDAFGAQAAVGDGGRALVSWASGIVPSSASPSGVFAALAEPTGGFAAPELLADAQTATLPQPTGAAIAPGAATVAWTGPQGARLARAGA
jgi:hypothetical protein